MARRKFLNCVFTEIFLLWEQVLIMGLLIYLAKTSHSTGVVLCFLPFLTQVKHTTLSDWLESLPKDNVWETSKIKKTQMLTLNVHTQIA